MNPTIVLLRRELLEQWRTMRLGVLVIVFLVVGLVSPVLARYTPELMTSLLPAGQLPLRLPTPTMADAVAQFIRNVGGTLTLAAVLLAMGMIASEKERGTAAFILTTPATVGSFVLSKVLALALALAAALLAAGLGAYAYSAWLFAPPDPGPFAAMIACVWLSHLAVGSITLLASAVAPSAVAAGAIGFAVYAAQALLSALPAIGELAPSGLQNGAGATALGTAPTSLPLAILANAALVLASAVLAWAALRRQEL